MSERVYDLIILGGGITGVGVGLAAAKRGFNCLIIEREKILSATSANSLRIIHGGFRYLQALSLDRTLQSIKAQKELSLKYPEYIKELSCIFPLKASGLKSRIPVSIANKIFCLLSAACGKRVENKILTKDLLDAQMPLLRSINFKHGLVWKDYTVYDQQGFHSALRKEYSEAGGLLLEGCEVSSVSKTSQVLSVGFKDHNSSEIYYSAHNVVNCLGPWIETVRTDIPGYNKKNFKWCKAYNLVFNKKLETDYALGIECRDLRNQNRLYFITPREDFTVIGTEYAFLDWPQEEPIVHDHEIESFVNILNSGLPDLNLKIEDLSHVEAGVLPIKNNLNQAIALKGKEEIFRCDNYYELLSTKYTTFAVQALKIIKSLKI